ncbi:MAG: ATPase [Actinomycetales bacterium]|nr:MAG: ATPase [Actinomycetales bacterium]
MPSPALFAASAAPRAASAFGRVDDNGVVYVKVEDGEREVGSYPGASAAAALAYFGRKYEELAAAVVLLHQRVDQTDIPTKEATDSLAKLREQIGQARVVGDLAALQSGLDDIDAAIERRRESEAAARAEAKAAATERRESLVTEAERIAAQPEQRIQWKASGSRMRELLDEWKSAQRNGPRIDKDVETALWHRFSAARNGFDKARRTHFARLDAAHGEARQAKEKLVAEAERLAKSRDWAVTAGAFKRLMDDWRRAGRANRSDDDALWARFKTAQDTFFAAKDAVVQAQEETYRANLTVKEALLAEAEAILPVTDLEKAKAALRVIQDKWDKAGRVPRADLDRTERALRRVEQAVRDAEDKRWSSSNPEAAARASSLVQQLEKAVAGLEADLAAAQATGNATKVAEAEAALAARRQWLEQAQSGLAEFGG